MSSGNHIRNEGRRKRTGYYLKAKVNSLCMCHAFESKHGFSAAEFEIGPYETNQSNKQKYSKFCCTDKGWFNDTIFFGKVYN